MSCLYPRQAWIDYTFTPCRIHFKPPKFAVDSSSVPDGWRCVPLPCGKCFNCQKARALDLTVRAVAESRCYDYSSFVTLTVSDELLPSVFPHGLCHRPWQLFAKRLRKHIGRFRFLMCGEYGKTTERPHYHAVVFGHKFVDTSLNDDGTWCPSVVLRDAWSYGQVQVSPVNSSRVAYVAGYTLKDFTLGRDAHYWDSRGLGRPYVKWSTGPGLGYPWYARYWRDLFSDPGKFTFVLDGRSFPFRSRYFLDKTALLHPEEYDKFCLVRDDWLDSQDDVLRIMRHCDSSRRADLSMYELNKKRYQL